ncbi:MAG: DUF362 domain-containing protein [Candidatus Hydrothermarchaeota archaeon]
MKTICEKTKDREKFVKKIFYKFREEMEEIEGKKILIKPNIVSYEDYPTTTHPITLETVIKELEGNDIIVGDAPAVDARNSDRIIKEHALNEVCERYGIKLLNLYKEKTVKPDKYSIRVFKILLEADYVVSLPVLKTHRACGITGALKNHFGFLPRFERIKMHMRLKDIHKSIAELNLLRKADLYILDAICVLIGAQEIRHGGTKRDLGYMIGGTDPLEIDLLGLKLLKRVEPKLKEKEAEDILHIKHFIDLFSSSR